LSPSASSAIAVEPPLTAAERIALVKRQMRGQLLNCRRQTVFPQIARVEIAQASL
jgi:hypothetical protein